MGVKTLVGGLIGFAGVALVKKNIPMTTSPTIINGAQLVIGAGIAYAGRNNELLEGVGFGVAAEGAFEFALQANPLTWAQAKFKGTVVTPPVPGAAGGAPAPYVPSATNTALQTANTAAQTAGNLINTGTNDINAAAGATNAALNLINQFQPAPSQFGNNAQATPTDTGDETFSMDDGSSDDDGTGLGTVYPQYNHNWN